MNIFLKKYKTLFLIKAFIAVCFFVFPFSSMAQDDSIRIGRLSDIDTTIEIIPAIDTVVVPASDEEENAEEEEDDEKSPIFFIEKNAGGGPDSFVLRTITDSAASALKNDKSFWYADKAFHKKAAPENFQVPFWQSSGFQSLMWVVIIIAFVGFLILYLKDGNISIFRKTKTIAGNEDAEGDGNIFVINYQKEIDKATAAGDYRLAIRLMYLRLLKNLSEKGAIQYTQDKTNFDYLIEASSKKWYHSFFTITRHYEYAWYGQFEVDSGKFEMIKSEFINFEKQV